MNILLIGDPHFKIKNPLESEKLKNETLEYIENNKLDFVIIMGDILDTHEKIHLQPLCRANEYLIEISKKLPLYIIIGNHDRMNNNDFLTNIHPFTSFIGYPNITVVHNVIRREFKNKNLIFVPYVPNGRFKEALEKNIPKDELKNLLEIDTQNTFIFAHQEFKGCKMGAFISENGDIWPIEYPTVFSGHIHDFQIPQKNIIYTGTPFQHGYNDTQDKFIVNLNIKEKDFTIDKYTLKSIPKKRILSISAKELKKYKVNTSYDTKLVIEGDGKVIKKLLLNRDDIQNYKIKDNTFKTSKNSGKNKGEGSFEKNFKKNLRKVSKEDIKLLKEIISEK